MSDVSNGKLNVKVGEENHYSKPQKGNVMHNQQSPKMNGSNSKNYKRDSYNNRQYHGSYDGGKKDEDLKNKIPVSNSNSSSNEKPKLNGHHKNYKKNGHESKDFTNNKEKNVNSIDLDPSQSKHSQNNLKNKNDHPINKNRNRKRSTGNKKSSKMIFVQKTLTEPVILNNHQPTEEMPGMNIQSNPIQTPVEKKTTRVFLPEFSKLDHSFDDFEINFGANYVDSEASKPVLGNAHAQDKTQNNSSMHHKEDVDDHIYQPHPMFMFFPQQQMYMQNQHQQQMYIPNQGYQFLSPPMYPHYMHHPYMGYPPMNNPGEGIVNSDINPMKRM